MKNNVPEYAMTESQFASKPDAGTTEHPEKQAHGQSYPGTKARTASAVTDAKCVDGAARKALDTQIGMNDKDSEGNVIGNGMRGN